MDIEIEIEGVTPLLMHAFTDAAQLDATNGARAAVSGDRGTPYEQAASHLYLDDEGRPAIPQPNMLRCLIDAGKFFKAGKSKVTTQQNSLVPACVDVHGLMFPVEHKEAWQVDARPIRNPATGGRVLRYRPRFDDWRISFEVTLDETIIGVRLFREIVDAAGRRIGLGDFRPDRKGPFGKFAVVRWDVRER